MVFKSANVTVIVSDFERAVRFYTQTLGLPLMNCCGNEWAEVQAPGVLIGLHPAGERGARPGPGGLSIGLAVGRLEEAMDALGGQGVRFAPQITQDGPLRIAYFGDPDNNPLYLIEVKAAGAH